MTVYEMTRAAVRQAAPDLWAALHPRTYAGAGGWCDPAVPAASLGGVCAASRDGVRDGPGMISILSAALLAKYRVPTYHVGRDLLHAVARTDPPAGMRWDEVAFPMPAGLFLFPTGAVRDRDGRAYDWVSWARVRPHDPLKVPGDWDRLIATPDDALVFTSASAGDPAFGHLNVSYNLDDWPHAAPPGDMPDPHVDGEPLTESDADVMRRLASLAVGLLLAMAARPDLAPAGGRRVRTIKGGPAREEWSPNWVGRDYAPARPAGGTHASPRLHWRRGHYRRQPFGEGRKEVKIIWLEPTLVGQ